MADINLQAVHDFMIEIARKVGERITSAKPTTGAAGSKKNCKLLRFGRSLTVACKCMEQLTDHIISG